MQQKLDYESSNGITTSRRAWRLVIGIVFLAAGGPITLYFGIGTLFVWGAVEQGIDRSVNWGSVWLMVALTLVGIGMFTFGLVMVTRSTKPRSARIPPAA